MNPLTIGKGKLTKIGVGITAFGPLAQNLLNVLQGQEAQNLVDAAQGTIGSVGILIGAAVAFWGAARASLNYGGK